MILSGNQQLAQATDANNAAVTMHVLENGKSVLRFGNRSGGSPSTLSKLRVGLKLPVLQLQAPALILTLLLLQHSCSSC